MPGSINLVSLARRLLWPLLMAVLVVSWSSGFVGVRYASEAASILQVLFWRTMISGLILLPFALLLGPGLSLKSIGQQVLYGVMIVFVYLGGFALAIAQRVPTGLVALMSDLVPLAIAVLSHGVLGERLGGRQMVGTGVAVFGVVLVSADSLAVGTAPVWAYLLTVAAMLVFALATVLQKRFGALDMPVYQSLPIQFLSGAFLFGLCAWLQGEILPPVSHEFVLGVAWLVIIATFLCYSVYYSCLRLYPATQVSAAIYLSPPVTMLWGWALFGEPLTWMMAIGLIVTMVGVWLTMSGKTGTVGH